jgi:hypothetical protein
MSFEVTISASLGNASVTTTGPLAGALLGAIEALQGSVPPGNGFPGPSQGHGHDHGHGKNDHGGDDDWSRGASTLAAARGLGWGGEASGGRYGGDDHSGGNGHGPGGGPPSHGSNSPFTFDGLYLNDSAVGSAFLDTRSETASVLSAANETIYANAASGYYSVGSHYFSYTAMGNPASIPSHVTIEGGTAHTELVETNNNSFITIEGGRFGSGTYDALGNNVGLNASLAGGGEEFDFGKGTGNATLVGSSAGEDSFDFTISAKGSHPGGSPHTVLIEGWQASDSFFFTNLQGTQAADKAALNQLASGGSATFADGTTVTFIGNHPTSGQIHILS